MSKKRGLPFTDEMEESVQAAIKRAVPPREAKPASLSTDNKGLVRASIVMLAVDMSAKRPDQVAKPSDELVEWAMKTLGLLELCETELPVFGPHDGCIEFVDEPEAFVRCERVATHLVCWGSPEGDEWELACDKHTPPEDTPFLVAVAKVE